MSTTTRTEINQYLTFRLAEEQYAIKVTSIKEVLELPPLTRVPRMPEYMSGVINLRGSVVPVIDLKIKFDLGTGLQTNYSHIIVTEIEESLEDGMGKEKLTVGIFSDSVQEVLTLEAEDIEPAPRIGIPLNTEFLLGMGRKNDEFILILNIDRILCTEELTVLQNRFDGESSEIQKNSDSQEEGGRAGDDTDKPDH